MASKILVGGCSIGTCKLCNHKDKMLDEQGRCDDCIDEIENEGLDGDEAPHTDRGDE